MDTIVAVMIALLGGFAAYFFKDLEAKKAKREAAILDLELQKAEKKRRIAIERAATAGARRQYEKSKQEFEALLKRNNITISDDIGAADR